MSQRSAAAQCARCKYTSRPCRCEVWIQEQARRRNEAIQRQNAAQQAALQIARERALIPVSAPLASTFARPPPAAPFPGAPRPAPLAPPRAAASIPQSSLFGLVPPPHSPTPFGVVDQAQQAALQIARERALVPVFSPLPLPLPSTFVPPPSASPILGVPRPAPLPPRPAASPIPQSSLCGLVPPRRSPAPFGVVDQATLTGQQGSTQFLDASLLGGQSRSMPFFNPASQGHRNRPPNPSTSVLDPNLGQFDLSSFLGQPLLGGQSGPTSQGHQSMPSSLSTGQFDPSNLDLYDLDELSSMLGPSWSSDLMSCGQSQTVPSTASLGQLHVQASGLAPLSSLGQPGSTSVLDPSSLGQLMSTPSLDTSPSGQPGLESFIDSILTCPSSSSGQPTSTPNPPQFSIGQHGAMAPVNSPVSEEVQSAAPREDPNDQND